MDEFTQLKKLPPWAWGVAVIGGLALFWWSKRTTSTSTTPTATPASNVAGQQALAGSINTVTPQCTQYPIPNCDPNTQTLIWETDVEGCPQPVCQTKSNTGTQSGTMQTGIVRGKSLSGCTAGYDAVNSGVPVQTLPNALSSTEGSATFGSSVTVTGAAVLGGSNFTSYTGCPGSNLWYPVSLNGVPGYINAYDLVSVI